MLGIFVLCTYFLFSTKFTGALLQTVFLILNTLDETVSHANTDDGTNIVHFVGVLKQDCKFSSVIDRKTGVGHFTKILCVDASAERN